MFNKIIKFIVQTIIVIIAVIVIGLIAAFVATAWTNPSANPPGGGGALYFSNNNVGIGTTAPGAALQVKGASNKELRLGSTAGLFSNSTYFTDLATLGSAINLTAPSDGTYKHSIFSYTNTGGNDDNLGIFARNDLKIVVGAVADRGMIIKTGGNVGIGTTGPGSRLVVQGSGTTSATSGLNVTKSDGTSVLFVRDDGRVGIGTTTPAVALDIHSTTGMQNYRYNAGTLGGYILVGHSNSNTVGTMTYLTSGQEVGKILAQAVNGSSFQTTGGVYWYTDQDHSLNKLGTSMQFKVTPNDSATAITALTATNAGNVGIGTTSPSEKLHIAGGATGNVRVDSGGGYYGSFVQAISSTGLKIGNDDYSGYMFFADTGNVGIGTTTPGMKLDVYGAHVEGQGLARFDSTSASIIVLNSASGANDAMVRFKNGNTDKWFAGYEGTSGNYAISTGGVTELLSVQSDGDVIIGSGNVGIGTTGPQTRLEIGANSATDELLTIRSQGKAGINLLSDTANTTGEPGGAYINFAQDGSTGVSVLGTIQTADQDARGTSLTGAIQNATTLSTDSYPLQLGSSRVIRMTFDTAGNVGIGTTGPGGSSTAGTKVLSLGDGTAPVGGVANQVSLYSSSGELYALDSAGNTPLLSPHDKNTGEWIFYSKNTKTGRVVRVNMEQLVKEVERLSGKQFMFETFEEPAG